MRDTNRREFLKTGGAAAVAVSWNASSYAAIVGANDRVRVGVIGCGDRMKDALIPAFQQHAKEMNFGERPGTDRKITQRGGRQKAFIRIRYKPIKNVGRSCLATGNLAVCPPFPPVFAAFLTTAATAMIGSSDSSKGGTASSHPENDPNAYFVDSLFRWDGSKPETEVASASREAATVLTFALQHGGLSSADKSYLEQMVVAKTGATQSDANARVTDMFAKAQASAEATRKTLAHTLLWTFVALLIGAFCSSFAGTIGGRQRDQVVII